MNQQQLTFDNPMTRAQFNRLREELRGRATLEFGVGKEGKECYFITLEKGTMTPPLAFQFGIIVGAIITGVH
jgi:hypothetical protein